MATLDKEELKRLKLTNPEAFKKINKVLNKAGVRLTKKPKENKKKYNNIQKHK